MVFGDISTYVKSLGILLAVALSSASASGNDIRIRLTDEDGNVLAGAVAYLESVTGARLDIGESEPQKKIVRQQGEAFTPLITTMVVGDQLQFQNDDPIVHHIYSFSQVLKLDLMIKPRTSTEVFTVEEAGVMALGSSIQDHMTAFVYVAPTGIHGLSDQSGEIVIKDIPAGEYKLSYWHYRIPKSQTRSRIIDTRPGKIIDVAIRTRRSSTILATGE